MKIGKMWTPAPAGQEQFAPETLASAVLMDETGDKTLPQKLAEIVEGAAPASHKHTTAQITDFPTSMPASDVPDWAKALDKPTYTPAEVGALAATGKAADSDKLDGYHVSDLMVGNPNLLHNADFRNPVNQRGVSGSVSYNGYFYDRWIRYDQPSTSAIILGAGYITVPVGVLIGQNIEGLLLSGKTVTLSIMLSNGSIYAHTNSFPSSGTGTVNGGSDSVAYYNFRRDSASVHIQIVPKSTALNIARVKLELGTVSTLHLDPMMDYAAELEHCRRYLKPLPRGSGRLFNLTSSVVELAWDLNPPMRIAPSLYIPSLTDAILIQGVGLYTPTSFSLWEGNNSNLFVVKFNGTYGGSHPGTFLYATGCFAIAEI